MSREQVLKQLLNRGGKICQDEVEVGCIWKEVEAPGKDGGGRESPEWDVKTRDISN